MQPWVIGAGLVTGLIAVFVPPFIASLRLAWTSLVWVNRMTMCDGGAHANGWGAYRIEDSFLVIGYVYTHSNRELRLSFHQRGKRVDELIIKDDEKYHVHRSRYTKNGHMVQHAWFESVTERLFNLACHLVRPASGTLDVSMRPKVHYQSDEYVYHVYAEFPDGATA